MINLKRYISLAILFSFNGMASTEIEKEHLTELVAQLQQIKSLAIQAKNQSSDSSTVNLSYEKLLWDLTEMGFAIERHLTKPSTSPRDVKDLYLSYEQ